MKSVKRLLEISGKANIAEELDDQRLTQIASRCISKYTADLETCEDKFTQIDEYVEIAKQVIDEKSEPWQGAANAKYPLLTVAAMQFNARAYPALVPAGSVVKARTFGDENTDQKIDRGNRVSKHMSYQLLYGIDDWQENMDTLLLQVPIIGSVFKKTFRNPVKQQNESTLIMPRQLVVNNDETKTLESAPFKTEVMQKTPHDIKANIANGVWRDADIKYSDEDRELEEEILEIHALYDIYEDGNKEPYIITIHKKSNKVLRIKGNFDEDTIFVDWNGEYKKVGEVVRAIKNKNLQIRQANIQAKIIAEQAGQAGRVIKVKEQDLPTFKNNKVLCVEPIQYYTEYYLLPSFDGKFYKSGFGDLIASISGLIDSNLNQMFDAGTLANMQGGLRAKTTKMKAGSIHCGPGEFPEVETGGMPIRDAIMPFNFRGPAPVLFQLLGMMIEAARDITSVKDIMVGDAPQGETATTTMIKREEGMRVFSAIYKRLYRSMSKEFRRLYELNRRYLTQDEYFRFGDSESYITKEDYEDDSLDIIPVADPSESTNADRILKAQALMQFMGDPEANASEIKKNFIMSHGISENEYSRFFPGMAPAPPSPDVQKTMAETGKLKAETAKLLLEQVLVKAKSLESIANAEAKEVGTQLEVYRQTLEEIINGFGADQGMVQQPGNQVGIEEQTTGMVGDGAVQFTDAMQISEGQPEPDSIGMQEGVGI